MYFYNLILDFVSFELVTFLVICQMYNIDLLLKFVFFICTLI